MRKEWRPQQGDTKEGGTEKAAAGGPRLVLSYTDCVRRIGATLAESPTPRHCTSISSDLLFQLCVRKWT